MLIVNNNEIRISRGDAGSLSLTIPISSEEDYEFSVGDKIQFRIFEKKGYNKNVVFEKEITVDEATTQVTIPLTSEEMEIGEPINKPTEYWYEIDLNNEQTVIGYDEEPAQLILLPAKGGE